MSQVGKTTASESTTDPVITPMDQEHVEQQNVVASNVYINHPLKINAPERFSGDKEKLETFIIQLRLCFGFWKANFSSESSKVLYAASLMRGPPAEWMSSHLKIFLEEDDPSNLADVDRKIFKSFEYFSGKLRKLFGDPDAMRTNARKIQLLRQTGSIQEYTAKFMALAGMLEWDDDALKAIYYKGLKDQVKDELSKEEISDVMDKLVD